MLSNLISPHPVQPIPPEKQAEFAASKRFLQQALLKLLTASLLTLAVLCYRYFLTKTITYFFLLWNIVLAWIPLLLVSILHDNYIPSTWRKLNGTFEGVAPARNLAQRIALRALHLLFLILCLLSVFFFLPNSFYILSDLIHPIRNSPTWYQGFDEPNSLVWFDLLLILQAGLLGLALGSSSLISLESLLRQRRGWPAWASISLTQVLLLASSFGVFIGRFERFNSWDILWRPSELIARVQAIFYNLSHNVPFLLMYFIILSSNYFYFRHQGTGTSKKELPK